MHTPWNELNCWAWGGNSPVLLFCSIHVLRQAIVPYMIRFKEELVIPPPKGHDKTQHNQLHHHRKKPSIHVVGQECDNVILLSRDEYDENDKFRTYIDSYDVLTHQRRELYAHESTLKIVSASVNPQRTVLAFTAKKSKVIGDHHDVAASSPGSQPVPPGS